MSHRPSRPFAVVNIVVSVLFLVSAVLQWNDPDPWAWVVLYAFSGIGCLLAGRRPAAWSLPAAACGAALIWAAVLAPGALPSLELRHLAESMQAETPAIEMSRELLGLLIVALWTGIVAWTSRRRDRAA